MALEGNRRLLYHHLKKEVKLYVSKVILIFG